MNINQVWPEWQEDCILGEGSFGKVYRAKRSEYGRNFYSAIKVLSVPKSSQEIKLARSQGMNDEEIYNYFSGIVANLLNEITLMDNLKGAKNIVGIEDYKIIEREGELGWDIFIRMELLTPFDSFISNPDFSQKDVIRLGVDICSALEICEQNYIIHRDIKPDNIFISRFGEYKLGDFGIARKLEATQANLSRKGTLNYMAPEIYKSEEYGSGVDIYSLGLVLYTLLNNNRTAFLPPYPQPIAYSDNEKALSRRLSGEELPPPCNAGASLAAVIAKACAYRPQDRYRTAGEFKNALIGEWNVLVQSGDNREIRSDALRFCGSAEQRFQNTTNDMTANGHLVVEEYEQETTVLNRSGENPYAPAYGSSAPCEVSAGSGAYSQTNGGDAPITYGTSKSNRACRIIAYPMALAVCVLAAILIFGKSSGSADRAVGFSLLGIGLSVLLADTCKLAVGLSAASLSLPYIAEGLSVLLGGIRDTIPVPAVISLLAGVLMLFAGIVTVAQREVRFGGTLCLYSLAVEALFNAYKMINGSASFEMRHIFCGVAAVAVFVWAYGYKSGERTVGIKKIFGAAASVISAAAVIQSLVFALGEIIR